MPPRAMIQQSLPLRSTMIQEPLMPRQPNGLRVAGLFAGIGGIEVGLEQAGHKTALVCEIDDAATAVLKERLWQADHHSDVRSLDTVPEVDLLTAGFPCQDLSIAGQREGIGGTRSSLVGHVFRLIDHAPIPPRWILLENVPFMLQLQNGRAMEFLVAELERRQFRWAYRVVDTRAFGLPQRRARLLLLASRSEDPRGVLLSSETNGPTLAPRMDPPACGFYWTEGHRGIGWSEDAVPPIKIGSSLGIPSAPAVWNPRDGSIFTLDIRDLERLQGFDECWTEPALSTGDRNARWKLVGNSVSVPLAKWFGDNLLSESQYDSRYDWQLPLAAKWPSA